MYYTSLVVLVLILIQYIKINTLLLNEFVKNYRNFCLKASVNHACLPDGLVSKLISNGSRNLDNKAQRRSTPYKDRYRSVWLLRPAFVPAQRVICLCLIFSS